MRNLGWGSVFNWNYLCVLQAAPKAYSASFTPFLESKQAWMRKVWKQSQGNSRAGKKLIHLAASHSSQRDLGTLALTPRFSILCLEMAKTDQNQSQKGIQKGECSTRRQDDSYSEVYCIKNKGYFHWHLSALTWNVNVGIIMTGYKNPYLNIFWSITLRKSWWIYIYTYIYIYIHTNIHIF